VIPEFHNLSFLYLKTVRSTAFWQKGSTAGGIAAGSRSYELFVYLPIRIGVQKVLFFSFDPPTFRRFV